MYRRGGTRDQSVSFAGPYVCRNWIYAPWLYWHVVAAQKRRFNVHAYVSLYLYNLVKSELIPGLIEAIVDVGPWDLKVF